MEDALDARTTELLAVRKEAARLQTAQPAHIGAAFEADELVAISPAPTPTEWQLHTPPSMS